MGSYGNNATDGIVMELFRYFENDPHFLAKLLMEQDTGMYAQSDIMFIEQIFSDDHDGKYIETRLNFNTKMK